MSQLHVELECGVLDARVSKTGFLLQVSNPKLMWLTSLSDYFVTMLLGITLQSVPTWMVLAFWLYQVKCSARWNQVKLWSVFVRSYHITDSLSWRKISKLATMSLCYVYCPLHNSKFSPQLHQTRLPLCDPEWAAIKSGFYFFLFSLTFSLFFLFLSYRQIKSLATQQIFTLLDKTFS